MMNDSEIDRFASNIHFLREWRFFNYEPRVIRFAPETGCSSGAESQNEITLSQFSAAEVPKCNMGGELGHDSLSSLSRKDFILYAGGLVWAVDWCPRLDQEMVSDSNYEFLAVAAHPPDSTYHKLGAPLSGRGMVQIWCLLNCTRNEDVHFSAGSTKQKYKKTAAAKKADNTSGKPRGRPRKNPVNETPAIDPENYLTQDLVQLPDDELNKFHVGKDLHIISTSEDMLALVQLPEDALNKPHVEKDSQSIFVSQNTSTPIHENMQPQKNIRRKENITFTYKRRRRKPRERTIDEESVDFLESEFIPALAVQFPDATDVFSVDETLQSNPVPMEEKWNNQNSVDNGNTSVDETAVIHDSERLLYPERMTNYYPIGGELPSSSTTELGKRRRIPTKKVVDNDLDSTIASLKKKSRKKSKNRKDPCSNNSGSSTLNKCGESSFSRLNENVLEEDGITPNGHVLGSSPTHLSSDSCHDKQNLILPQAVFCLGHDGKVAWDVKWRPVGNESVNKYRMGYLAVVLGNGSIEVWDIPFSEVVRRIYVSQQRKDTDPRFAKLKPVFKCSKVNYGDRVSMPLTVEWSSSPPHDLLLAGCHDGVVAVWKFSTKEPSEDARPLLCFSAETGPIRALSWAPFDGDPESSHVIVTAGHGGLKFWDLRDPYRPLWDANPSQRFIYGLDWLPNPRCVLVSYDDGNLRTLSLLRSAYDVPVTGEPFSGTLYQGLASYSCSSSAIWSIHISRQTGIVAYCRADGAVLYYQLTHKAVEKDPTRNRAPHFLCGSLASEGLTVTLNTELPTAPYRMKKSATEWTNTPRSARTVSAGSNHGKRVKKGAEKSPNPSEEVLTLCYDDGSETHEAQKSTKSKQATNNQALVTTDGEGIPVNMSQKTNIKDEARSEVEEPPPKLHAMYRVRWNMNRGSERWLCYGGAAGIVRCQEIVIPEYDKKLLKR